MTATPTPGRTWDSSPERPGRRFQALWVTIGVLALPPGLLATALRVLPATDNAAALLSSFIAYGTVAYLVALIAFGIALVRARRRLVLAVLTVLSAALLTVHLAWLAPFFVADDRPPTTDTFTVMSLNMLAGRADSAQVAAVAQQADVVVLLEATPTSLYALRPFGWKDRFPYSIGDPDDSRSGSAIYSRYPLTARDSLPTTAFQQWVATAEVPDVGPVTIMAVHPCNPFCGGTSWVREHQVVREVADAHRDGPLVVAGDFNAVDDHQPLRQLRRDGLVSATDITGAGWLPTYPANKLIPPMIPIDHVLVSPSLTAVSIRTFRVDGTDHLGLMAVLAGTR